MSEYVSKYRRKSAGPPPCGMTLEEYDKYIEDRVAKECEAQGIPLKVSDPVFYDQLADIFEEVDRKKGRASDPVGMSS